MEGKIILVGGGARSGKSQFAVCYAERLGERRVLVATAQGHDQEMRDRIAKHRRERGGRFATIEEPIQLSRVLHELDHVDVVLVDCLTLWLSNLLLEGRGQEDVEREVDTLSGVLKLRRYHTVLVSNEVGMGIVPENALARLFRDVAGATHKRLAGQADEVFLAAMGMVMRLLPSPLVAYRAGELP